MQALRWAIGLETDCEERRTFLAPHESPWATSCSGVLAWRSLTTLYGLINNAFIPRSRSHQLAAYVATATYLHTEFALRPFAAQASAGPPPRRLALGNPGPDQVWLLVRVLSSASP